jgi:hypothetical protein
LRGRDHRLNARKDGAAAGELLRELPIDPTRNYQLAGVGWLVRGMVARWRLSCTARSRDASGVVIATINPSVG